MYFHVFGTILLLIMMTNRFRSPDGAAEEDAENDGDGDDDGEEEEEEELEKVITLMIPMNHK